MDKRSKGKKILFVCERNSAQSPFVSKTYITSQRNFIHSTIQDGGALQPLPGKAKEHDGTKLDMLILKCDMSCWIHVGFYSQWILSPCNSSWLLGYIAVADHPSRLSPWAPKLLHRVKKLRTRKRCKRS